ncbi:AAA family ATPase [Flavobacterium sp. H4147]|uniref:AAA family ATPase n=1 Tax=Flavobacterium sp. H4147 TaxID=3034149 RepID=UPI0023ED66F8|nr:AAA family ATPase [Flavobacterium sp. H4147]
MEIKKFKVENLHQHKTYEILFQENKLILVAGNGSGKTTLVNIFYNFISRQWNKLLEFNFEKITLWIDDETLIFNKEIFQNSIIRDSHINKRFSPTVLSKLNNIIATFSHTELLKLTINQLEIISQEFGLPYRILRDYIYDIQEKKLNIDKHNDIKYIEEKLNLIFKDTQIIYLPTYRRIEKDLKNIFPHLESNLKEIEYLNQRNEKNNFNNSYLELVEFGMSDVSRKIKKRCIELKNYFYDRLNTDLIGSYLDDILNKSYRSFDIHKIQQIDSDALDYILNRLDESVISPKGKENLTEFVEELRFTSDYSIEDKINAHFVWKLFQIYDFQQKEETDINLLISTCNKYFGYGKTMEYNKDEFNVQINLHHKFDNNLKETFLQTNMFYEDSKAEDSFIDFKDLSSGEKQIVSLFTHLILNKQNYFLIIDEPELSLSVPWQEELLPDILKLQNCSGLLSVTHSPFIFQNNLRNITHSLEEFIF